MNKTFKAVRLDYITIAPYFTPKNLFLFVFIFVFLGYFTDSFIMAMSMLMMYGLIFASYPFAVGDKNGIDTLYFTLPVKRGQVVAGRYLFSLSLVAAAGLVSFLVAWTLSTVFGRAFDAGTSALALLMVFGFFTFLLSIQLPIFFRLGYSKAKFLAYVPLAAFAAATAAVNALVSEGRLSPRLVAALTDLIESPGILPAAAALLWLATLLISIALSLRFYKNREF